MNPKIKAIVTIRSLASGLRNNWNNISEIGIEIDQCVKHAGDIVDKTNDAELKSLWRAEIPEYVERINSLKKLMGEIKSQINSKQSKNLREIWNNHSTYSSDLKSIIQRLENSNTAALSPSQIDEWNALWTNVNILFADIQKVVDACSLQLGMIEKLAPAEIDELTHTILSNIPESFELSEAEEYEAEYMAAYERIKKEASQNKNLWDRFLDILAGGTQQSPSEIVMMQRWVNGEKGEL